MGYRNDPREMKAKFQSTCPETGNIIREGDTIVYFPRERKAHSIGSNAAKRWRDQAFSDAFGMADAGW